MTLTYVLLQNLRRNPMRTALTAASFALPMGVFVAAISLVLALISVSAENEKQLRLAVRNKITLTNAMPERMRKQIEALDPEKARMSAVCGMRWFGGRVPNAPNVVQSLGADADTFPDVYPEIEWTREEREAWSRERIAAVAGAGVAEQYGWKLGDRVTLQSTVPPYLPLEFRIIKIVRTPGRTNALYFHREYLEESRKSLGYDNPSCNIWWVRCNSLEGLRSLQREIDAMFANSPHETKSDDENAFAAGFVQATGDLPGLMRAMAIVVVFIVALVAGNTMMLSFRERTRELAVFKAIGFQSGRVFRIVMAESVLLALFGAVIGIVPVWGVLTQFPLRRLGFLPIAALEVSPIAVGVSLGIALLVGGAAGLWPAYQALRLRTVDALRKVG